MHVGICIPAVGVHLKYLEKCLECINLQTRKPDLISISISEYIGPEIFFKSTIPIILSTTAERKDAATNRNIAAGKIQDDVDILMFVDCDDFIHPEKVNQTIKYFRNYDADCLLHGYLEYPKEQFFKFNPKNFHWPDLTNEIKQVRIEIVRDVVCGRLYIYDLNTNIKYIPHNAHLACRIKVWKDIKYPENDFFRCEDSEYNYRVFKKGYKYIFTNDNLCLYVV